MDAGSKTHSLLGNRIPLILAGSLLLARLGGLLKITQEALLSYGNFIMFYSKSSFPSWPFINNWVEYPPLYPFLNAILNLYLLPFVLLVFRSGKRCGQCCSRAGCLN